MFVCRKLLTSYIMIMPFVCESCSRFDCYLSYVCISCVLHVTVKELFKWWTDIFLLLCVFLVLFPFLRVYLFYLILFWYCKEAQERVWSGWEGVPILMARFDDSPSFSFCSLSVVLIYLSPVSLLYIRVLCMKLLHSGYVKKRINIIAESGGKLLHLHPVCQSISTLVRSLYRYMATLADLGHYISTLVAESLQILNRSQVVSERTTIQHHEPRLEMCRWHNTPSCRLA